MSEYAVVWRETGEPHSIYAGGLSIETDRVVLRGSAGRHPVVREVPRSEIGAVQRVAGQERLGGFPSLRLDLNTGRSLLLASVMGVGVLFELLDSLGG
jgi:hypothetical protein